MNKTLKWNLGLLIIRLGYKLRGSICPDNPNYIEKFGKFLVGYGHNFRGQIPMKTYV